MLKILGGHFNAWRQGRAIQLRSRTTIVADPIVRFFPIFKSLKRDLKPLYGLEPVNKVQVKGMDEVGVVIAFQVAL
jgi:hypothetical protein